MSNSDNDQKESQPKSMKEHFEEMKARSMTREEYFNHMQPDMVNKPFRLDMIYVPEKDIFIIQGDENGLKKFGQSVLGAGHPNEKVGFHVHWDDSTTTYMNVQQVIVQRVNTNNDEGIVEHN